MKRLSEKDFLEKAIESVPTFIAFVSKDEEYRYVNSVFEAWFGKKREIIGKKVKEIVPDSLYKEIKPRINQVLQGKRISFEVEACNKNGKCIPVITEYTPQFNDKGEIIGYALIGHDISKQKQIENRLKKRIEQQNVLTGLGLSALAGLELEGLMNRAVSSLRQVLGVDYVKVLENMPDQGKMVLRAGVGWNDEVKVDESTVDTGKDSQAGYTLMSENPVVVYDLTKEKRFRGPKLLNDHKVKSGISCIIWGTSKIPWGVLGVHSKKRIKFTEEDVKFLQSVANIIAQTLQRSQLEKQKDEFISVASHELKTPLTSLKGFAQILEKRISTENGEKNKELVKNINLQAQRLSQLINNILDVGNISNNHLEFKKEVFNVDELIADVVSAFEASLHKHKLEYVDGTHNNNVVGDRDRIEQVLINLISNAIKYSPNADKVTLVSQQSDGLAIISVRDYGMGIPDDERDKVFKRFYRTKNKNSLSVPGFGLGLYIASEIIKGHGGRIWVDSEHEKGATFSFSLPLVKS